MDLKVIHETRYDYRSPAVLSQQLAHLKPRELPWQSLRAYAMSISPQEGEMTDGTDYFGNPIARFLVTAPHSQLLVRAESVVRIAPRAPALSGRASATWEALRDRLRSLSAPPLLEAAEFMFESPQVPLQRELSEYASVTFAPGRPILECARELAGRIHADFRFDATATSVATPLAEVFAKRRGVCQDFAHLMIGCLRVLGLSARYISGYILTKPPPGKPRLIGADASHAWVSVFCPPLGWVDLDPTNNCLVDTEHVTLAWGRDFSDVPPLRGVILGGDDQILRVGVTVLPLIEAVDARSNHAER